MWSKHAYGLTEPHSPLMISYINININMMEMVIPYKLALKVGLYSTNTNNPSKPTPKESQGCEALAFLMLLQELFRCFSAEKGCVFGKMCIFAGRKPPTDGKCRTASPSVTPSVFYVLSAVIQYCIFISVFFFTPTVSFAIPMPTKGHSMIIISENSLWFLMPAFGGTGSPT